MPPQLPDVADLFDETPCGLLVTAVDGTILRVNATFCRWVGAVAHDLVGRRKLQELFTAAARIFHQTHWLPMLQVQGSVSEMKFDVVGIGGKPLPMLFNVVRRNPATGPYDQVVAVIAEQRNRYERELAAERRRADALVLREQDRALFIEQMVGVVSHDLRQPLSAAMTAAHHLAEQRERLDGLQTERLLASITEATGRSQRLIRDLLDFTAARVGQGLRISWSELDLHQVAAQAVAELSLAFPNRRIEHRHAGPGRVDADADRLAQLLGHLVANAMTHGDEQGTVTVSSSTSGNVAELAVHNTGAPIPSDRLTTLFEPMLRSGEADDSARGVGLGLYLVRAIALAHGGDVSVRSAAAEGTEFRLRFPAQV